MKVKILRLEHGFGFPRYRLKFSCYREIASVDYPTDHKWTEIERRVIDRLVIEQEGIELEWNYIFFARLNRVFIRWGRLNTYFHIKENKCTLDEVLPTSQRILDELKILDPFRLMVISAGCTKMPDHLRKRVRQAIYDVIDKVLEGNDQEEQSKDQEQRQEQSKDQDQEQRQEQETVEQKIEEVI